MNKKVALIQPTFHKMDGKPVKGFTLGSCPLELPLLAAIIPSDWEKTITHEYFDDIDYSTDASVVFITSTTNDINYSREIACRFKELGKTVIFGGHEDELSEVVLKDVCDSFYRGIPDARDMNLMLTDVLSGELQPSYSFGYHLDYPYDYSVYKGKKIRFLHVRASTGCLFNCEYCRHPNSSVGGEPKFRDIDCVIEDLRSVKKISKYAAFKDPNFYNSREYLIKLCSRIIDEKIGMTWGAQMPIYVGKDEESLKLMYKAGCRMIYIGFETLEQKNLVSVHKPFNVKQYLPLVKNIQQAGIRVAGYFMLGFDYDTKESFNQIFDFVKEARLAYPLLSILMPIPGTKLFERMKAQGRLDLPDVKSFIEKNPLYSIPCNCAYYEPMNMTRTELRDGFMHLTKRLASFKEIFRRSFYKFDRLTFTMLKMNLSFRNDYLRMAKNYVYSAESNSQESKNLLNDLDVTNEITEHETVTH